MEQEETTGEDQGLLLSPETQRERYRKLLQEFPYLVGNFASWTGNEDLREDAQLADLTKPGPAKKQWDSLVFMTSPFHVKRVYGPHDNPTYVEGETITLIIETATLSDDLFPSFLQFLQTQRGIRRHTYAHGEHIIEVEATGQERRYHEIESQPLDEQREKEDFRRVFPTRQRFEEVYLRVFPGASPDQISAVWQASGVFPNAPAEESGNKQR